MSSVASAAAQLTGLPPNVEPWAPALQVITDSLAMKAPIGMPEPRPFAVIRMSGSTSSQSHAHIFPVRPDAALHLVGHQQDAVPVADLAQPPEEADRRDDVAALALDRLDEDAGDVLGAQLTIEELLEAPASDSRTDAAGSPDRRDTELG